MQTACEKKTKQECISVGCVPPAAVAVTDGGCGPGPDPPQLPPWVWAWTRSPSASPLGVGLETPLETWKACWNQTPQDQALPLGPGPPETRHIPKDQAPPAPGTRHPPPVNRITDTLKNITLLQTSFAGGNNNKRQVALQCRGSVNRWFYHSWTFTLFPLFLTDNG